MIILFCSFSLFVSVTAFAEIVKSVKGCIHNHIVEYDDDGTETIDEVVEAAKENGCEFLMFTSHSDRLNRDEDFFAQYREKIASKNEPGFVAVAGREIALCADPSTCNCHITAYSEVALPYMHTKLYGTIDLDKFIKVLKEEHALYCLNHIKDCPAWVNKINLFPCMELMNDAGVRIYPGSNYGYQRDLYLKNIKKGGMYISVIGGEDRHFPDKFQKKLLGYPATDIFVAKSFRDREITREDIIDAIQDGRTIATKDAHVLSIDPYPSIKRRFADNGFEIKGKVRLSRASLERDLNIYKNGTLYKTLRLKRDSIDKDGTVFSFSFREDNVNKEEDCYNLEIVNSLFSSEYCYSKSFKDKMDKCIQYSDGIKDKDHFSRARCYQFAGAHDGNLSPRYAVERKSCYFYLSAEKSVLEEFGPEAILNMFFEDHFSNATYYKFMYSKTYEEERTHCDEYAFILVGEKADFKERPVIGVLEYSPDGLAMRRWETYRLIPNPNVIITKNKKEADAIFPEYSKATDPEYMGHGFYEYLEQSVVQ